MPEIHTHVRYSALSFEALSKGLLDEAKAAFPSCALASELSVIPGTVLFRIYHHGAYPTEDGAGVPGHGTLAINVPLTERWESDRGKVEVRPVDLETAIMAYRSQFEMVVSMGFLPARSTWQVTKTESSDTVVVLSTAH